MSERFLKRKALKLDPAVMAKRNSKAQIFKDIRKAGMKNTARALFRSVFNVRDF